ncbi:MAG TPA: hypothetical protein VHA75_00780, partial [Rugosimonospora sp.]|nr:hypothetical protein [Rugosimonospora sp.]
MPPTEPAAVPSHTWSTRLRPSLAGIHRAARRRARSASGSVRRAWRRSLQLRMVVITLVISGVLVAAFGFLVATLITNGLIDHKVSQARRDVTDGGVTVSQQLLADPTNARLDSTLQSTVQSLASAPAQGSDVIVAIEPSTPDGPLREPRTSSDRVDVAALIPADLRNEVRSGKAGGHNKLAYSFVTVDAGHGPQKFLVY